MLINQVVVEAREGSIVAKAVPQRRIGATPFVNPLQRLIAADGDQARISRAKSIKIRLAGQLCHPDVRAVEQASQAFLHRRRREATTEGSWLRRCRLRRINPDLPGCTSHALPRDGGPGSVLRSPS